MARQRKPIIQHHEAPRSSMLLSLPVEIRTLIWKTVIEADPILLYETHKSELSIGTITALSSRPLTAPRIKGKPTSKGLAWLRTNRQIYTEAQPLLANHLDLVINHEFVFRAFIIRSPKLSLDPLRLRNLTFCLNVEIESDLRDGFYTSEYSRFGNGWAHRRLDCSCPYCSQFRVIDNAKDRLPALRQLNVVITFTCGGWGGQGNQRPVIGTFANGRPRMGQLYRPKNPSALVLKNSKAKMASFAGELYKQMPLRFFHGMMLERVLVVFNTDRIKHNKDNECSHPRDRCWCIGRSIAEQSLTGLKGEITRLMVCAGEEN